MPDRELGGPSAAAGRSGDTRQLNELLEDAIESLDEGFALYDAEDRLIACNRRYRELYGFTDEECALGTSWPELLRRLVAAGRHADAIGREAEFVAEREARWRNPGGSYEIRLSNGRWLRATDRRTCGGGTVSIRTDITEQKATEQRLTAMERAARESEERLREIVAANPVPMTITRVRDGLVVYANQRAADMVLTPLDAVIGAKSVDFYADTRDRDTVIRLLREQGKVDLMEIRFRRGDGTTFPAAVICRPILYAGEPAVVSGLHDLTEWKRMEAALHQNEKMAALGSLLAGVAHELNNPLTVVVSHALMMRETAEDQRVVSRADKIRLAAERCSRIVRTFLALARQRKTAPALIQLNDIVTAAVELLAYQLRTSDVKLSLDLDENLPTLWADADQLNQVMTNLIVNAGQALAERPSPRRLSIATSRVAGTDRLRLTVADNGPGVGPEIRSRIFEPFFTTKPPGMGTGIGLSMCLSIVNAHGGTMTVEDTAGGGATFVVELPLRPADAPGTEPAETAPDAAERTPAHVLVVDDEPEIAEALRELLAAEGHSSDIAENGAAALQRLAARRYDAVISDLRMPVLDGAGLYGEIERRHPNLLPRIAFITGDSLSIGIQKFLARTNVICLEKPFGRDELRRLLAGLLPAPANLPAAPGAR